MTDQPRSPRPEGTEDVRFEATVHPGEARTLNLARVADLDLDRVPDPQGLVRVLVTHDECTRLVAAGFEVRLHRAVPIRPLDPRLVAEDDAVLAWFSERARATDRTES